MQASFVTREIPLAIDDLVRALLALNPARHLSLLDSCGARPPEASANLIAGFDPYEIIEAHGDTIHIETRDADAMRTTTLHGADALVVLDGRLAAARARVTQFCEAGEFAGACIATFSYDLVFRLERLRTASSGASRRKRQLSREEPDATYAFYDTLIVHDYARGGRARLVSIVGERQLDRAYETLMSAANSDRFALTTDISGVALHISTDITRDEYYAAVRRIKEHIYAGDIYQANLTQRFSCQLSGTSAEEIFLRLRRDHPATFAAFCRRREDTVISASPERFLRVDATKKASDGDLPYARTIEAWPIKGTHRRGQTAKEDARLRRELMTSAKDRAENVMIVDLLRNDLGRICRYGSIEVTALCALETHPTLYHLVSRIRGLLRVGTDGWEVSAAAILRATFPCGSITGAPKIRAMEIIDEIEPTPRGISMGAIGYFAFDGAIDLNVAIRTMVVRDNTRASFRTGGGIVAESTPESEYEESQLKALALLRALGRRK